jgi:hypothetical protein
MVKKECLLSSKFIRRFSPAPTPTTLQPSLNMAKDSILNSKLFDMAMPTLPLSIKSVVAALILTINGKKVMLTKFKVYSTL